MVARRRPLALLSALLLALALALAACGGGATAPEPTEPPIAGKKLPGEQVPTADAGDPTPSEGEEEGDPEAHLDGSRELGGESAPFTATTITGVWPDESWQIEELAGDACAGRAPEISRGVLGEDYFGCGAEEDRLIACKQVAGEEALCVRDPLEKTAVRIHSPAIVGFTAPAPEAPKPLLVVLADGTTCTPVPRDDVDHHAGRQSWLHCGEYSALLLDFASASFYFDPSGPVWTAELGVGGAAPTVVEVRTIIYAGTPEDVEAQGFQVG